MNELADERTSTPSVVIHLIGMDALDWMRASPSLFLSLLLLPPLCCRVVCFTSPIALSHLFRSIWFRSFPPLFLIHDLLSFFDHHCTLLFASSSSPSSSPQSLISWDAPAATVISHPHCDVIHSAAFLPVCVIFPSILITGASDAKHTQANSWYVILWERGVCVIELTFSSSSPPLPSLLRTNWLCGQSWSHYPKLVSSSSDSHGCSHWLFFGSSSSSLRFSWPFSPLSLSLSLLLPTHSNTMRDIFNDIEEVAAAAAEAFLSSARGDK